jgi:cell division septal protein FtsQ
MRRKKIVFFVGLFILLITSLLIYLYNFFTVKRVYVIGNVIPLRGINSLSKENLLLFNNKNVESNLKNKNPSVKNIIIRKTFPNILNITTIRREAIIEITDGKRVLYLDEDGIVLEINHLNSKLPQIKTTLITFGLGNMADWKMIKAKNLIIELEKKGIFTDQIAVDDNSGNYILKTNNKIEIIIPLKMEINILSASLQLIISRFRIEGKIISKIDFQFEKPVVVLKNGGKMSSYL